MDVRTDLKKFIQTNFILGGVDAIDDDGSFLDRNLIDSTGVLELVGHLESTYSIDVEDAEIVPENFDSVNLIIAYLGRKGVAIDEAA